VHRGVAVGADDIDEVDESAAAGGDASASSPLPREAWGRYLVALIFYVALSVATLSLRDNVVLLNWIIGPLFPVVVLYVIPTGVKALVRRWWAR
jgi:hypothetical protein